MLQINRNNEVLTPGGEEQVAILVFCKLMPSSVPRSDWEGEEVLFFQGPFLSWLYRIQRQRSVLNG